ncbi:MAG: hypothetical protein HY027_17980 [Deltaproteobacteria bacterium]|nr:hypothetical protein [Deltaproteobacteria bacterium]
MRTVKRNPFLAGVVTLLAGVLLVASGAVAQDAVVGSDKAAALLVFPKLIVNNANGDNIDTEIQISNSSPHQIAARCFLVNANSHCSNAGATGGGFTAPLVCDTNDDCNFETAVVGGRCIPGWTETDFRFHLTAHQPIVWLLSEGMSNFPLDGLEKVGPIDNDPNLPANLRGQAAFNFNSRIPPAPEVPFKGELKCVQVDLVSEQPSQGTDSDNNFHGDLEGQATIDNTGSDDAESYNAIGIQAVQDSNDGNDTLCLGAGSNAAFPGPEYAACPGVLILNHFFDDADEPVRGDNVRTTLTLVPCSENFGLQNTGSASTTVQFLVYNEFEQRFSTSKKVTCYLSIPLSDIDSQEGSTGDDRSIFNVAVAGTLTGQTRIRAVDGTDRTRGDGLLAIAEEVHDDDHSAAFNVDYQGSRARQDVVQLSGIECTPENPCP